MKKLTLTLLSLATPILAFAQEAGHRGGEANLKMPENFADDPKTSILYWGFAVVVLGLLFGFWQFSKIRKLKAHKSMLEIGNVIFKTCSTYLKQQGKFLFLLFVIIGAAIALYFGALEGKSIKAVILILGWTVIGILGSYGVAWFGVRMNTYANARMAFASLRRKPLDLLNIASEVSAFGVSEANYDAQRACAEISDLSLQNPNEDVSISHSEGTDFRLNEPPSDRACGVSELSGFILEAVS